LKQKTNKITALIIQTQLIFSGSGRSLQYPRGIACNANDELFVADFNNRMIRKLKKKDDIVYDMETIVDNLSSTDKYGPFGIAIAPNQNILVNDYSGNSIYTIDKDTNKITILSKNSSKTFKDGKIEEACFNALYGIASDSNSNIYIADYSNHRIRKISKKDNYVSTVAGSKAGFADGFGTEALFNGPFDIAVDKATGDLFVTDHVNCLIRKIIMPSPENPDAKPYVKTIAGIKGVDGLVDGNPSEAQFSRPFGIAVDADQNIIVADFKNNVIRRVNFVKYTKYYWDCLQLMKSSIGQNCLKKYYKNFSARFNSI